jgi:hypothetical protein
MPPVLRIGRFRSYFFSNERNEPHHIHVKAAGDLAKFWLVPVRLAANFEFNAREIGAIHRLVLDHRDHLTGVLE